MDVLSQIDRLRLERGWSEYRLAVASGIAQSTISSWYRKGMLPSAGSLEKLCKGLGVSMSQFFSEEGEMGTLPEEQRQLLANWNRLLPEQRAALLALIETI